MNHKIINIALVDDHALFRSGLANLLREFKDIKVVFEASNGQELQQILKLNNQVDVILMDINMPVMDGYAATSWVKKKYSGIHVLALSMFDDEIAVLKMLKAGAGGYVLKESKPLELYKAINEINNQGIFINEMVTSKIIFSSQNIALDSFEKTHITEREIEFIKFCASDLTYKEIATEMNISPRSVDNYRENVFDKFKVRSRVGMVLIAIKHKLINIK